MRYSLDEIETFLAVMELGTVTAAAARLNLAKSVVSKRISDLEAALGAALFRRNAGRIVPTDSAFALAERLRPALAELVAAAESLQHGKGEAALRGTLAIAAPMSFGTMYLGPIIARFAEAHPDLALRVEYDDRARDLAREGFDIGVRLGFLRDNALMHRKLCEDRRVVCASPDYLARHGVPNTPADLGGHQIISYVHIPNSRIWQFQSGGQTLSPPVHGRLSLNNGEAMRDMAMAGLGVAVLPGFIAGPALAAGQLVEILADFAAPPLAVVAVWPPVTPMPAKLRLFVDHLVAELEGGKPWARFGQG